MVEERPDIRKRTKRLLPQPDYKGPLPEHSSGRRKTKRGSRGFMKKITLLRCSWGKGKMIAKLTACFFKPE